MSALPQSATAIVPEVPDPRFLVQAFASFTDAAASLERSYSQLQSEVVRLRRELEESNRDLARSLEENQCVRRHLDRIVEGLPCGVLVVEEQGEISIANPEARRLLGLENGTALESWDTLTEFARGLLDSMSINTAPESGEREFRCAHGQSEWIAVRRAELARDDGESSIFILRDISQAKRLEEVQDALRRRQALAEMSAVLAHEIRNPLGSLELFAGLLAESPLDSSCRDWVRHLQAGLRMLAATVNNVLQFHHQPPSELAPTDLGALLNLTEEFLRPLAQQEGVEVRLQHALDDIAVAADRHRLQQVLFNLALNAFRAMPSGGGLTLGGGVQRTSEGWLAAILVSDTGPGIAPEDRERIFRPGFTTRPGSPGLGLAVCRSIMEQHGGSIAVSSSSAGTTFTLEFPLLGAAR